MTSNYPADRIYRATELARRIAAEQPKVPRVWNNRQRWKVARVVIKLYLCYSRNGLGNALITAGLLIKAIDATWQEKEK